jgi:hypothetical protein
MRRDRQCRGAFERKRFFPLCGLSRVIKLTITTDTLFCMGATRRLLGKFLATRTDSQILTIHAHRHPQHEISRERRLAVSLEAMKMEMHIAVNFDCEIDAVHVIPRDRVAAKELMIVLNRLDQ